MKIWWIYIKKPIKDYFFYKELTRLKNVGETLSDPEKEDIINYLKTHKPCMIPYTFTQKYVDKKIDIQYDIKKEMWFAVHLGKLLYFPGNCKKEDVLNTYRTLLMEQDPESPHCYESADFAVEQGDVVADVGAAEGIFALNVLDKADKIYCFETDEKWIKALNATFAPYKDKVEIINKCISATNSENSLTLDAFFKNRKIDFIKADIEGAELNLLKGSKNILNNPAPLKVVLCTYHNPNDAEELEHELKNCHFKTSFSKGYILTVHNPVPPYFRRGVIRAKR